MHAIIVEDERNSEQHLCTLLAQYCPTVVVGGIAHTLTEAYELLMLQRPELVFLDIELGNENSFSLLEGTKADGLSYHVIFTTAHEQYGIRAIKFSALDYLLKPITPEELTAAVKKAQAPRINGLGRQEQIDHLLTLLHRKEGQEQTIAIPVTNGLRFLALHEICHIEASNNYSVFHLETGEDLLVSKGIFYYDRLLAAAGFLRVHQSHLVNPRFVRALQKKDYVNELELRNGKRVPVSRLRVDEVRRDLLQRGL